MSQRTSRSGRSSGEELVPASVNIGASPLASLAFRDLEALPAHVTADAAHESLDLTGNLLVSIAATRLPLRLRRLALTGNHLSALPHGIARLPRLQELFVGCNLISDLSPAWACPTLLLLNAPCNVVATLDVPPAGSTVISLDVGSNALESVDAMVKALTAFPDLKHLRADGNPACITLGWRDALRAALPKLSTLDGLAEEPPAADSGDDAGATLTVAGPDAVHLRVALTNLVLVPEDPPAAAPAPAEEEVAEASKDGEEAEPPPEPPAPPPEPERPPIPPTPDYYATVVFPDGTSVQTPMLRPEPPEEEADPKGGKGAHHDEGEEGEGEPDLSTAHAALPVSLETADLLARTGVRVALVKRTHRTAPAPPPEPRAEGEGEGAEGEDGAPAAAAATDGEEPPQWVPVLSEEIVAEGFLRAPSLLSGLSHKLACEAVVPLVPRPTLFPWDKTKSPLLSSDRLLALDDPAQPTSAMATVSLSLALHVAPPPPPAREEEATEEEE